MAKLGAIELAGHSSRTLDGKPVMSAVAFTVADVPTFNFIHIPSDDTWEIEVFKGRSAVVARTSAALRRSDLLGEGLEQIQRCLDLLAFEQRETLVVKSAGEEHLMVYRRDQEFVADYVDVTSMTFNVHAELTVRDSAGNIKPPTPRPPSTWNPALRFYRMSYCSRDLYEAYRNLWLSFESLLSTLCPLTPNEREEDWLKRALRELNGETALKAFVPATCADPVAYFVGTQYKHIRCRLFHAKGTAAPQRPDIPDPEEAAEAYQILVRVLRGFATKHLSLNPAGVGMLSEFAFKTMQDSTFGANPGICFTEDSSPVQKSDTQVSPLGLAVFRFDTVKYLGIAAPGRVRLWGRRQMSDLPRAPIAHRICVTSGDNVLTVGSIEGGLDLDGIDSFESQLNVRLFDQSVPRIVFDL